MRYLIITLVFFVSACSAEQTQTEKNDAGELKQTSDRTVFSILPDEQPVASSKPSEFEVTLLYLTIENNDKDVKLTKEQLENMSHEYIAAQKLKPSQRIQKLKQIQEKYDLVALKNKE